MMFRDLEKVAHSSKMECRGVREIMSDEGILLLRSNSICIRSGVTHLCKLQQM